MAICDDNQFVFSSNKRKHVEVWLNVSRLLKIYFMAFNIYLFQFRWFQFKLKLFAIILRAHSKLIKWCQCLLAMDIIQHTFLSIVPSDVDLSFANTFLFDPRTQICYIFATFYLYFDATSDFIFYELLHYNFIWALVFALMQW